MLSIIKSKPKPKQENNQPIKSETLMILLTT